MGSLILALGLCIVLGRESEHWGPWATVGAFALVAAVWGVLGMVLELVTNLALTLLASGGLMGV